jgi:hypothetical protein
VELLAARLYSTRQVRVDMEHYIPTSTGLQIVLAVARLLRSITMCCLSQGSRRKELLLAHHGVSP